MNTIKAIFSVATLVVSVSVVAVEITVDKVTQRYPWNGIVDIEYTIDDGGVQLGSNYCVQVLAIDHSQTPAVTNAAYNFNQAPFPVTSGKHRIMWNANADGVEFNSENVEVAISILRYSPRWLIIDLSEGSSATNYSYTVTDTEPVGINAVENEETYKLNKLVLRLIPPGSYMMGSPSSELGREANWEAQHRVVITRPFYVSVFEVTKGQYYKVCKGTAPTGDARFHPVSVVFNTARGSSVDYDWPSTNGVDNTKFMGLLRTKTGLEFDLLTEAQWEYACRAGTTTALYDGVNHTTEVSFTNALTKLARYRLNVNDGKSRDGSTTTAIVGSYLPNAFGLYDMLGNLRELCLDHVMRDGSLPNDVVDPPGWKVADSTWRCMRGGDYGQYRAIYDNRCAERNLKEEPGQVAGAIRLGLVLPRK